MNGDHARAAQLLASLSEAQPGQAEIAKKALSEALGAGRIELALQLARSLPPATLATDARLLLVGEEIKHGHSDRALTLLDKPAETGDLTFLDPLVRAWTAADHGDAAQALSALDTDSPEKSAVTPASMRSERSYCSSSGGPPTPSLTRDVRSELRVDARCDCASV